MLKDTLTTNMSVRDCTDKSESDLSRLHIFKVIVIGDSNVGKTCLTVRFCCGKFRDSVKTTIGFDCLEKTVVFGDDSVKVSVILSHF
jgi:Ras-related protein Rab-33A